MSVKISVVIPSYRPDFSLYECLASLERQTFAKNDFEVILVLNGEKEPYFSEITKFLGSSGLHALLLYEREAGVSRARNIGIKHCTGDYVTFIDADDFVSESYLQNLFDMTVSTECLILANVLCYSDEMLTKDYLGIRFQKLRDGKKYGHIRTRSYFSVPIGKILPIGTVQCHLFKEDLCKGEDSLFMFEIEPELPKCMKALDSAIYYRRLSPNSLSRAKRPRQENFLLNVRKLKWYSKIYFTNFSRYNVVFFLTRILAVLRGLVLNK